MKNTIRCCISCILPCGALDVIRIVHSNGHVEEISGTIKASDIMRTHPKHVLKKPPSPPSDDHGVISTKIVIVPPDAELQRGKIYFLMPVTTAEVCAKTHRPRSNGKKRRDSGNTHHPHQHHHRRHQNQNQNQSQNEGNRNDNYENNVSLLISDRYLSEILSEKISTQKDRRRGRVGVWRPHLESISEASIDD